MWNWISKRESTIREAPRADTSAAKPRQSTVSGKYLALYNYLEHRYADVTTLTFTQIEDLLGFALPQLARTQQTWWAKEVAAGDMPPHAAAWLLAGRTATANLLAQTVIFSRAPSVTRGLA